MSFLTRINENKSDAGSQIYRYIWPKNKVVHVVPLFCPFELTADNQLIKYSFKSHFCKGQPSILCEKAYSDSTGCSECEKTNSFGQQNFPTTNLTFPAYVLDCKGQTYTSKKTGKEFPDNPEKIIEIPSGKKQVNWDILQEAFYDGDFMDTIWKIKKIEGGFTIQKADIKKLGNQLDTSVPKEVIAKYADLTSGQKIGYSLSIYQGVNWKHPDLVSEGIVSPYATSEESEVGEDEDSQFSDDPLD